MRTVSAPSQTEILKTITQPGWLAELHFSTGIVRLSSFGSIDWDSTVWVGAQFAVTFEDGDGRAATITIWDYSAAFRTAALTAGGCRNRQVTIWQAQYPALAAGDPNMVFFGVGDQARVANGRLEQTCSRLNSGVMQAPRMRITPDNGFRHLAAPGAKIHWGDTVITLTQGAR